MKKLIKYLGFVAVLSVLLFNGCTKDNSDDIGSQQEAETIENPENTTQFVEDQNKEVYNYLLSLGFSAEDIVEMNDSYWVEGDIRFGKDMTVPEYKKSGDGLTSQRRFSFLISNPDDVTVRATAAMNPFLAQIDAAIVRWNNASSRLQLRRITTGTADISIDLDNALVDGFGRVLCGLGAMPTGGQAGPTIFYNDTEVQRIVTAQGTNLNEMRIRTLNHELGHNIGFAHTNSNDGLKIPGTPTNDAISVMNGGQCGTGATTPSANDRSALRILYPQLALNPTSINLIWSNISTVNITGTGPVSVSLSGDPGLILFHGSTSGTTLNLTAPTTFEVFKQSGSGFSRIFLNSSGSTVDMAFVNF